MHNHRTHSLVLNRLDLAIDPDTAQAILEAATKDQIEPRDLIAQVLKERFASEETAA